MDISTITDIDKLKALAYDALTVIEQYQQNLRVIQERINELQAKGAADLDKTKKH